MTLALAGQVQDASDITERLLGFLEVGKAHITAEALIQVKDLLRKYPHIAEACLASISATSMEVSRSSPLIGPGRKSCRLRSLTSPLQPLLKA